MGLADDIKTDVAAARTAIGNGEYGKALTHLRQARAAMAGIPKSGLADASVEYTPEAIEAMIRDLEREQTRPAKKGQITQTRLVRKRVQKAE